MSTSVLQALPGKLDIIRHSVSILYLAILLVNQGKKEAKDQESIQSSATPDPGYQWESDTVTIRYHNENQEFSPFPAGDHKASTNRRA